MSGLDSTGFTIELISDIRATLEANIRAQFGASLPLGDTTVLGHILGIIAEQLGLLWERAEQIYSSQDPDKATGAALDALSVLTGTFRLPAIPSTVTLTLCGDPATVVASGLKVATVSTDQLFDTVTSVTLALLTSWAGTTSYSVGDRVTNSSRCYQCIVSGTSAGSGGPTSTASDITDGTVHWEYIGEGTAAFDAASQSETLDAIVAVAGDLTSIQTPVFGLKSARNLLDAQLGRTTQSDQSLRLLREEELSATGSSTADAIRAALLQIEGVTSASVLVNNTDFTDTGGRPPHSFECLVLGGDSQTIVDTIANNMAAGIQTFGTSSGSHIDSAGNTITINYTRPTDVLIYVRVTLTYDATKYPADGDTEVKTDISTFAQGYYVIDLDADPSVVGAQAFGVQGVLGVQRVDIYTDIIGAPVAWAGTTGYSATVGARSVVTNDGGRAYICITSGTSAGSGGPTGTGTDITDGTVHWAYLGNPVSIDERSIAVFDTSRITVTSSAVAP